MGRGHAMLRHNDSSPSYSRLCLDGLTVDPQVDISMNVPWCRASDGLGHQPGLHLCTLAWLPHGGTARVGAEARSVSCPPPSHPPPPAGLLWSHLLLVLRQALRQKHQEAQQACRPHNLPVLQAAQQRELEAVEHRIREEQRAMDQKIVLELDRKVADQQSTLEKAGVAGFYVTTNPQELTLQMNLLELIRKLQQRGRQAGKTAL
ncbi:protein DGCR6L [Leptonychotes weddellii]|uniref:Protein DGCR6L n=1 Tax=Leptonychotes weddellii TaxID=9713 RepID=A0A7F8PVN1_LEPWE|nr:protein DGCR6L [Leptonychotes weddellii]